MPDNKFEISKLRLENAKQCLQSAKTLIETADFRGSANRSYYAAFHAMRAVLALDGIDSKKHSGIIAEFRKNYIKTGVFNEQMSDIISELFDIRTDSDYNDFYVISKQDVVKQSENADIFVKAIESYLIKLI